MTGNRATVMKIKVAEIVKARGGMVESFMLQLLQFNRLIILRFGDVVNSLSIL